MSSMDSVARLRAIGDVLALKRPAVLAATVTLLEALAEAANLELFTARAPTGPVAFTAQQVLEAARTRGVSAIAGSAGDPRILLGSLGLDLTDSGIRAALVQMHRRRELHLAALDDLDAVRAVSPRGGSASSSSRNRPSATDPPSSTWWWSRDLWAAPSAVDRQHGRPRQERGGPRHRTGLAHSPAGGVGMTVDLPLRLGELGAALAQKMPGIIDATLVLLESMSPALDAVGSGRYEVQRQIGLGGHAEVLLGIARGTDGFERPVAIKRVRPDLAGAGGFVANLIEEAHHAAGLSHPNVVSVFDLARDAERQPYLVMEHVDGVDLAALVETGPVPHSVAIFIVRELLAGLGYIHQARDHGQRHDLGLVHRDVKPGNVLLSWEGAVKLADFGLARMIDQTLPADPHAGEGTPGYLSPEQAHREALDRRSDLYAVGILLWELLAARRLRAGLPGDISATINFRAVGRPSEHRPVPADLDAVAMRLLAYLRDERYPTAAFAARELVCCQDASRDGRADLVRLLDERFPRARCQDLFARLQDPGSPISVRTATGLRPRADTLAPPPHGSCFAVTSDPSRQRGRRWEITYVALALVLVATISLVVMR